MEIIFKGRVGPGCLSNTEPDSQNGGNRRGPGKVRKKQTQ